MTPTEQITYWLDQLAKAERAADYARAQLAAARAAQEEQP